MDSRAQRTGESEQEEEEARGRAEEAVQLSALALFEANIKRAKAEKEARIRTNEETQFEAEEEAHVLKEIR